jgi:hypothetical protein
MAGVASQIENCRFFKTMGEWGKPEEWLKPRKSLKPLKTRRLLSPFSQTFQLKVYQLWLGEISLWARVAFP